ncbi:hypothetical protein [Hyphomicrobium sp. LHD-15]|uniref:hypothetical protein n=1 Tax=Hyphomicrobium sp. LHD-15 TaxID=3072142 RepID=UPI0028103581|nr:hypothetical protein [Hyphomicrobium sp. LHD-15]MDQ8700281.1 hypothetical protein [Hyphomicrobium sp. LHD-15]
MSSTFRAGLAALAVTGLALTVATSAFAGHRADREGGEAEVAGIGPVARDAAVSAAIADWKREVREETGRTPLWRTATEKRIACETERGRKTECEVEARPNF